MNEYYFYVAKRGNQYVAAIAPTSPPDNGDPHKDEIIISTILVRALVSPAALKKWASDMSTVSEQAVLEWARVCGENISADSIKTTQFVYRIPGIN